MTEAQLIHHAWKMWDKPTSDWVRIDLTKLDWWNLQPLKVNRIKPFSRAPRDIKPAYYMTAAEGL